MNNKNKLQVLRDRGFLYPLLLIYQKGGLILLDTNDILAEIGEINLSVINLKAKPGNKIELNKIKDCLNKIFPDSKCVDVIYTVNTDKMFFGMSTYAILNEI